jgi:glutaredoxin
MAIKLHRCPFVFLRVEGHGCWQAQKALDEAGIEYELVKVPVLRPRRTRVIELTGQQKVPVIELEDGTAIRAEGKELSRRIREGTLRPEAGPQAPAAQAGPAGTETGAVPPEEDTTPRS